MPDFTLHTYQTLLQALLNNGYSFQPFSDYIENPLERMVILRHDVDDLPGNSLKTAQLEYELGIRGTYYFRIVPQSNNPSIIRKIASLGHEIGYHYEDLALAAKAFLRQARRLGDGERGRKGDEEIFEMAIQSFERNLTYFRQFAPIKTICMHGSPLSRYDNRRLWDTYNYRDFGITGEPYFDIDFTKVLYLTDTGRRWDGERVSIRDKARVFTHPDSHASTPLSMTVPGPTSFARNPPAFAKATAGKRDEGRPPSLTLRRVKGTGKRSGRWGEGEIGRGKSFHSTKDINTAAENRNLPNQLMITVHPQRWTNNPLLWTKELIWQNAKNVVKRFLA